MLIKLIKNVFKIKKRPVNYKLLNSLKKYDIVYTNMKILEVTLNNIDNSHATRPFLITKVKKNKVKGYYLTSNLDNTYFKYNMELKFILSRHKYKLEKDSLVLYNKKIVIPKKYIIHYIDKLKSDDIKHLKKYKRKKL